MSSPRVSAVVATRDRRSALTACVASLLRQEPEGIAELIVVDDGSADGTWDSLAPLAEGGLVTRLRGPGRGAATARNVGIRRARAPLVAITDDDCEVPPDWAARLAARLDADGVVAVGGRVVAAAGASLPARLSQAITNGLVATLNADPAHAVFLTSNNVAYRADALRDAGLFDETFLGAGGEERELHGRLRACLGRLVYAPEIVVQHRPSLDWRGFLGRHLAYGRGARLFYRRGRALGPARPRHLSALQYARVLRRAWSEMPRGERLALAVGFVLSQVAVTLGFVSRPRRS